MHRIPVLVELTFVSGDERRHVNRFTQLLHLWQFRVGIMTTISLKKMPASDRCCEENKVG